MTITDAAGLSASIDLEVSVTNVNEPPATVYPTAFVDETAPPGTVVVAAGQLQTTDVDSGRFKYELVLDGNATDANGTLAFNVSAATGALSVGPAGLNYERRSSYRLTVQQHATDPPRARPPLPLHCDFFLLFFE